MVLKENGNKLVGRVIEIEEKSQQYVVKWSDGEVTFETSSLQQPLSHSLESYQSASQYSNS